jgi:hypothetical protein
LFFVSVADCTLQISLAETLGKHIY